MKKIILIASVFIVVNLNAQKSFEKKTNVIGFGLDLGVYNYVSTIGSSNSASTSNAANKMLSLQYERGILNWLGIGAKVQLSDYFTEKDAVNLYTVKCSSCHGSDGKLGLSGAKDLSMSKLSDDQILQTIKMGKNVMPSFEGSISNEQMKMLIPVVKSLRK